jgi:para-aminobenzoate synthetase/4-amino-4-deoxychorismate lyase
MVASAPPLSAAVPFVLLDDARADHPRAARLYADPQEVIVARRADEIEPALARLEELRRAGLHLAGWMAYEAGLALEPRLRPRADRRSGAGGPLLWFGAFAGFEEIASADMPGWLAARAGPAGEASLGPLDPAQSAATYLDQFATIRAAIEAGDIYQANLTLRLAGSWRGDPLALYAALRAQSAAGHGGILFDGAQWLVSLSPELFVALADGRVTLRPMKGTRPRHADPGADAAARADLAASAKDRAENLMILDLMRNDVSRVAVPGSVRAEAPFAIETYPTVHQMVSTVRARLAPGHGPVDLLRALFPCGSITGAPKIRAMELIDTVERDPRGAYCGAIGRIDAALPGHDDQGGGGAAFNVAIRTLRLCPEGEKGGRATLGIGSAVVADSDGMTEWRECLVKGGFVRASGGFDLIETMAFTPEGGIPLLELHLERAKASAQALGFAFDRHAIRNAIQALCFDTEGPARVRLLCSRSGAHALEIGQLPAPFAGPATCVVLPHPVDPADWRLAHKTTDRAFYAAATRAAHGAGADEALLLRGDGLLTEGSYTTLFVERGDKLLTPPLALGLLPGVLRRSLIEAGRAEEADLTLDDLAGGFLIGNALRGLIPARLKD